MTVVAEGESGSTTIYSLSSSDGSKSQHDVPVGANLSRYAGETVTLEFVADGSPVDIKFQSWSITIVVDTDGDGHEDGEEVGSVGLEPGRGRASGCR